MTVKLSDAEARRLLRKFSYGDFGEGQWATIRSLINKGMVIEDGKALAVTPAGREWCLENHMRFTF